jgi:hypothetical protein
MTSSTAVAGSCHVHSSSPLAASDHMQGPGYSESEVETDTTALELETTMAALELEMNATALELETDTTALDLKTETDVSQEISKQEGYSAD